MPRAKRVCLPDHTYHCYSRCIEQRRLLASALMQEMALKAVEQALGRYDFKLIQLEFVQNHFHMVVQTTQKGETISRIMQYIKARIAERYNRQMGRTGPFWNERFKCKIVEEADDPVCYFCRLMWYIAYNPVRKGMYNDPRESPVGAISCYLDPASTSRLPYTIHKYFHVLGQSMKERIRCFLEYEAHYLMAYRFI